MAENATQEDFLRELAEHRPVRSGGLALHWQCAEAIRHAIERVHYPAAVPLPPEKELSDALGVSRPTLRHALSRLANDGIVHSQRGVGTFALRGGIVRPVGMSSLYLDLLAAGREPGIHVLTFGDAPATPDAERALGVAPGTALLHLDRVRTADGIPIVLTRSQLSLPEGTELTLEQVQTDGLYSLLHRVAGIELVGGSQVVSARRIEPREAELLGVPDDGAVMTAYRTTVDARGRAVEYTEIVYPEGSELLISDLRGTSVHPAFGPPRD